MKYFYFNAINFDPELNVVLTLKTWSGICIQL